MHHSRLVNHYTKLYLKKKANLYACHVIFDYELYIVVYVNIILILRCVYLKVIFLTFKQAKFTFYTRIYEHFLKLNETLMLVNN